MAKPDKPLLSLGARGTLADSLTFQKRGRLTIVRRKPIPKDPKSPAQLARRQVYRDAVASWHSLTLEEKEAWRGVCPGLTAYQCFMKSELVYVPPVPPPEEYTEEQTQNNVGGSIRASSYIRQGQRLIIPNRTITKLAFRIYRYNSPTGDVSFTIRKIPDDEIILSKVWGNAGDLPADPDWKEVTFDSPATIDEEVRISCEFSGGDASNRVVVRHQNSDVKADELFSHYHEPGATWYDREWDNAYIYTYIA